MKLNLDSAVERYAE